jgi:protein-tyrosine phosphatase
MPDGGVPERDTVRRALDLLDEALAQGKTAYCWGGHGRTGLVAGCWLRRHGLAGAESVLRILGQLRKDMPDADRPSPETDGQRQAVRQWERLEQDL